MEYPQYVIDRLRELNNQSAEHNAGIEKAHLLRRLRDVFFEAEELGVEMTLPEALRPYLAVLGDEELFEERIWEAHHIACGVRQERKIEILREISNLYPVYKYTISGVGVTQLHADLDKGAEAVFGDGVCTDSESGTLFWYTCDEDTAQRALNWLKEIDPQGHFGIHEDEPDMWGYKRVTNAELLEMMNDCD